jgi:hypothetical protein
VLAALLRPAADLGFSLAAVGTIMEGVPPVCMTIGSARRRRRTAAPDNDDIDAPAPQ